MKQSRAVRSRFAWLPTWRDAAHLVVCVTVPLAAYAEAQEQLASPSFRATVTRVEVSAVVVDAQGRPVRDLRSDEVELFDGGRKQAISSFARVGLEREPASGRPASDSSVAAATSLGGSSSRLIALLIDDLHIDARRTEHARAVARQLLEQLAPSDLLFVGLTSESSPSTGVFTRDRRRARVVVEGFSGMRLATASEVLRDTPTVTTPVPVMRGDDMGLSVDAQHHGERLARTYGVVSALAEGLTEVPGRRKTLLLLTEGPAAPIREDQGTGPAAAAAVRHALARASAADLAIYPLSPSGLDSPSDGMIDGFTRAVDALGREVAHVDLAAAISDFLAGKNHLRDVAALTGGVPLIDRNDTGRAIAVALQDASDHYLLSYEPNHEGPPGALSTIDVRVSRPGLRVRTRRGRPSSPARAADARPDATDAMARLLRGLALEGGLPMTMRAFPVTATDRSVRYAIVTEVLGGPLATAMDGDRLTLEQALATVDATGRLSPASRKTVELRLPEAQVRALQGSALRTLWAVDLPPGLHQIRVATVQPTSGTRGTLTLDVDVEGGEPSQLLALIDEIGRPLPTAFVDPQIQALLPTASPSTTAPAGASIDTRGSSGPWATAVETYQRREYGRAAVQASALEGTALQDQVARELARWRAEADSAGPRRLKASAAMALEIALVHVQAGDAPNASRYLRVADEARDALRRSGAPSSRFTAQWELARLHVLLLARDFTGVTRAAAKVPVDDLSPALVAEWYVARGLAREAQSRLALWDRPTNTQVTALTPTHFDRELWMANERQAAVAEYRRALSAAPTHLEAQVRLGRVLFESEQAEEARTQLTRASAAGCGDALCGLAWLFLGDWHARHGTGEDSRQAYLQASGVLDVRQSALIGLLRLALREAPASASALVRQFDGTSMLSRQQTPDAWSRYLSSSPLGLATVIGALREDALQ